MRAGLVSGAAPITGGGLVENPPRALAPGLAPRFDWAAWTPPPVFAWLARAGGIAEDEMRRAFNCGIGFLLVVSCADADAVLAALATHGETPFVCGALVSA
jgi:phosphoribosylaminoimidazole (AIR) synthetase